MPPTSRLIDRPGTSDAPVPTDGALKAVLDRRASWVEALLILATVAAAFLVLQFLAAYFRDYFHLLLIFVLAWLLASLISPVADFLQRRLRRLPRAAAVIGVIVPVVVLGSLIVVRVVISLAESFAALAAALPDLIAHPPPFVTDIQAWLAARGIGVDVDAAYRTISGALLNGLGGGAGSIVGGAAGVFGTFADALLVGSLAIFMAIDRDRILQLGLELVPPQRREAQLRIRKTVGAAFSGFIRSQLIIGAAFGLWALAVSVVFGLPFTAATAFLSGVIMAIPIYGPYVSWLPPVVVAILVGAASTPLVAIAMLVGWVLNTNVLGPLVQANQLQVHPIVVTFAFLLGAQLAGPIGAIIAIPLAAVGQAFFVAYRPHDQAEADATQDPGTAALGAEPGQEQGEPGEQRLT